MVMDNVLWIVQMGGLHLLFNLSILNFKRIRKKGVQFLNMLECDWIPIEIGFYSEVAIKTIEVQQVGLFTKRLCD